MTNLADAAPIPSQAQPPARTSIRGLLAQTEIDLRLFGMLIALAVILLAFNVLSNGKLIQPTNMVTMAVQAAGIAIIATGMVLVIVSRNIDLSVGSLVGFVAMSYALLMTDWFPNIFNLAPDFPLIWVFALAIGICRQVDGFGVLGGCPQFFDDFSLRRDYCVMWGEVFFYIYAKLAFRQILDVADGSLYRVTSAQILANRFCLGGRFHNDERFCHRRALTISSFAEMPSEIIVRA